MQNAYSLLPDEQLLAPMPVVRSTAIRHGCYNNRKLLRVLQSGDLERLGSSKTLKVDTRVIATTNEDLAVAVKEGGFRSDLFYRLNVFPVTIAPLRERKDDLPLLLDVCMTKLSEGCDGTRNNATASGNERHER